MRRSQPWRTNRARVLRAKASSAEDVMWTRLRGRRLADLKFMRQCPIGPYFADFVCREHKVVVEIDGGTHGTEHEVARDKGRGEFLADQGYRIFRAHNIDVYDNLDDVLAALLAFARGEVK